jgi:hypothetical protein
MNPQLKEFFDLERKRVYQPDPYFSQRVMARLKDRVEIESAGIWDVVPVATRQVLALALTVLLALITIDIFMPVEPSRGMVEAYLAGQHSEDESYLYTEVEIPEDHAVLEHLIVLGGLGGEE